MVLLSHLADHLDEQVHSFLLRHVCKSDVRGTPNGAELIPRRTDSSSISTYRLSKFKAAFFTFLLSACVHELVMAVAMKKIRLYLFLMQVSTLVGWPKGSRQSGLIRVSCFPDGTTASHHVWPTANLSQAPSSWKCTLIDGWQSLPGGKWR